MAVNNGNNGNGNDGGDDDDEETTVRKILASLDVRRKAMENEADAIHSELTTPPSEGVEPMGIDTPLVDGEGYPRADIDVYRARTQRHRFSVLKTDHGETTKKIEALLVRLASLKDPSKKKSESDEQARRLAAKPKPKYDAVTGKWVVKNWDGTVAGVTGGDRLSFEDLSRNRHDTNNKSTSEPGSSNNNSNQSSNESSIGNRSLPEGDDPTGPPQQRRPFARVNGIAKESPAEDAGMKVGDRVTLFGSLDADNNDRLRALAKLVPEVAGQGGTIRLVVLRRRGPGEDDDGKNEYGDETKWERLALSLRPRPFAGRGLLGCHIVPCAASD